jgi:hypothetical protein
MLGRKVIMRKTLVVSALALVTVVGAGVAYSAASPSAKLGKQDRVYGGGSFGPGCFQPGGTICFEFGRNLALDAHAEENGAEAVGNTTYGSAAGEFAQYRTVTCLRVEGKRAAIGGVIEGGSSSVEWYVQYVIDQGGPGLDEPDLASASYTDVPTSSDWPEGFPYVCPSPTSGFPGGPPDFLPLNGGDIVVQDAAAN